MATLPPIIMVQWKMGVSPIVVTHFNYRHFPLNHDYGRKDNKFFSHFLHCQNPSNHPGHRCAKKSWGGASARFVDRSLWRGGQCSVPSRAPWQTRLENGGMTPWMTDTNFGCVFFVEKNELGRGWGTPKKKWIFRPSITLFVDNGKGWFSILWWNQLLFFGRS